MRRDVASQQKALIGSCTDKLHMIKEQFSRETDPARMLLSEFPESISKSHPPTEGVHQTSAGDVMIE